MIMVRSASNDKGDCAERQQEQSHRPKTVNGQRLTVNGFFKEPIATLRAASEENTVNRTPYTVNRHGIWVTEEKRGAKWDRQE